MKGVNRRPRRRQPGDHRFELAVRYVCEPADQRPLACRVAAGDKSQCPLQAAQTIAVASSRRCPCERLQSRDD